MKFYFSGGFKIQDGRGPPRFDFDPEQLKELLRRGFTVSAIAREGLLGTVVHRYSVYFYAIHVFSSDRTMNGLECSSFGMCTVSRKLDGTVS